MRALLLPPAQCRGSVVPVWSSIALLFLLLESSAWAQVRFNRDIRPLLTDNCFACHGPDARKREAKLRLDSREDALKAGDSGDLAIVAGEPGKSALIMRIESADRDEVMPPPKSHKQLSTSQKALLRQWVAEGAKYEEHWAFTAIERPAIPAVKNRTWPRNPIDFFILARLEQEGLAPAAEASLEMLLRRVTFDLIGLPPEPQELEAFVAQSIGNRQSAFANRIDRLLASTQYGEHWARHWMDVARYADSAGYELDYLFTHAWRYRDWLVRSLVANKPMDRFIREQIAGDELWPNSEEAADGARFLTIGPLRYEGGIQRSKDRENEWLTDLADTTGAAFLGLTMGCTRCHDHKFDPLTQNDYYGLQAIFAECELKFWPTGVAKDKSEENTRPTFVGAVLREPPGTVQVLRRGEVDLPLREAPPTLPASLPGGGALPAGENRRAALAEWLTSPRNPLTARVLANRIWQWHFGQGLVRTANDFGRQGEAPSYPELLDWLASELISSGWDLNHLHRLILESATYRQSSLPAPGSAGIDPGHRLLAGFPRRRLQAEELRDAMLAVSGELNLKSFGPPVVPPVEAWALSALRQTHWQPAEDHAEWRRRSIYFVVRRSIKLPFFEAFNSPETTNSCAGRDSTVVPAQALTLLNSEDSLSHARALAGRLWKECVGDDVRAVERAWTLVFGRPIMEAERDEALRFLRAREEHWRQAAAADDTLPLGTVVGKPASRARGAAWVEWCLALLNADEFAYVD